MRQIKFRAWDKADKVMMDNVYMRRVNMELIDFKRSLEGPRWTVNMECPDIILMQFTGLKDKNGKEIYEGDVVRTISLGNVNPKLNQYSYYEVKESETGGCWEPVGHGLVEGHKRPDWEVIGNIYENPEVLV